MTASPKTHAPRLLALLLTAAAATTACDAEEVAVEDLVSDRLAASNELADIVCDCSEPWGYEHRSDCMKEWGEVLPAQRRCIQDAYARDEATARSYLECVLPLQDELNDCIDGKLACGDAGPVEACFDDYDIGFDQCIQLPNAITRGLEQCVGGSGDEG